MKLKLNSNGKNLFTKNTLKRISINDNSINLEIEKIMKKE